MQPVNAIELHGKDIKSDLNSDLRIYNPEVFNSGLEIIKDGQNEMIYRTVENRVFFEYQEKTIGDIIYTKKYKILGSEKLLVEDYQTNIGLNGDILTLNLFDNMDKTTEQVELNLWEKNYLEPNIETMARCSKIWPSGYTGKTISRLSGHSYAKNYKINKGISRLGTLDIIVKLPDKNFDQYAKLVDSLVAQEKNAVLNAIGVGAMDQIIKASKKGVSLSTFKIILKNALKAVPSVGAVTTLYSYVNTSHKANVARDKLNGSKNQLGWGC